MSLSGDREKVAETGSKSGFYHIVVNCLQMHKILILHLTDIISRGCAELTFLFGYLELLGTARDSK